MIIHVNTGLSTVGLKRERILEITFLNRGQVNISLFVLLSDHLGCSHHTVGLNVSKKLLFDPMEESVMVLNNY